MIQEINKKLYYLVEWNDDKKKTWSGTCYGLYEALKLQVMNVEDINVALRHPIFQTLVKKIGWKLGFSHNNLNLDDIYRSRRIYKSRLPHAQGNLIQFAEWAYDEDGLNTYLYQDLTIPYVKYMSKNDLVGFKYSGFSKFRDVEIDRRYKSQMDYYRQCSGIFTMGKWAAKDLIERCGLSKDKVFHVGGGINLDSLKVDYSRKEGKRILFVGRDFERKGGFLVCDAFTILQNRLSGIELYVAGPPIDPMRNCYISGYHFMGECSHEQLTDLFNLCDIFVMPSFFEAYGLVFIEALTYGLPCIGRNAYEMPYFIEEGRTGYLLNTNSVMELAFLMEKLLQNKNISQAVRDKRKWYVREYSWTSVAGRMLETICKQEKEL